MQSYLVTTRQALARQAQASASNLHDEENEIDERTSSAPTPPVGAPMQHRACRPLWWETFGDALTDAHYDAVLAADCRRFGYYTPDRAYAEPAEDPRSIWARTGLGAIADQSAPATKGA